MSENFIRPTTDRTRAIVDKTLDGSYGSDFAMRQALRAALDIPDPTYETMSMPPANQEQQAAASLPVNPAAQTHMRVIYPAGNSRFELYGDSEESLDAQEQRIRSMYPQQQ
jgi:hypothetical protein